MVLFLLVDLVSNRFNLGFPYRHSKKFSLPGKAIRNPFFNEGHAIKLVAKATKCKSIGPGLKPEAID